MILMCGIQTILHSHKLPIRAQEEATLSVREFLAYPTEAEPDKAIRRRTAPAVTFGLKISLLPRM